jgi:hypothetical protein
MTEGDFTARSEEAMMANALSDKERTLMDAYWRAAINTIST